MQKHTNKPTKRGTICILGIITLYILMAYTEGHAQSARTFYENNFSYTTRNACRDAAGRGRHADYAKAIACAIEYEKMLARQRGEQAYQDWLKSSADLNRELTKELKRR